MDLGRGDRVGHAVDAVSGVVGELAEETLDQVRPRGRDRLPGP